MDRSILFLLGGAAILFLATRNNTPAAIQPTGTLLLPGTTQTVPTVMRNGIMYVLLNGSFWVDYNRLLGLFNQVAAAAPNAAQGQVGSFILNFLPDVLDIAGFYANGGTGVPPLTGNLGVLAQANPEVFQAIINIFSLGDTTTITL